MRIPLPMIMLVRPYRKKFRVFSGKAFIEKGGWDKMPGEEQASPTVARACANGLEVLLKK
jgi:hypothetical protein